MAFDIAKIKVEPEQLAHLKKELANGENMMEIFFAPGKSDDRGDPQLYRGWLVFTEDGIVFGQPG